MQFDQQALTIAQAMQIGRSHHQAGRLPEAERICQSILQADPNHPDALNLLGIIAHQAEKYGLSVELIEKAIRHQPSNPDFLNNLGLANRGLGQLDKALACYDGALALRPDHVRVWSNRGNVLQELKRFDEAIVSYRKALLIKPDYAEAHTNLGNALKHRGEMDEAIASYSMALSFKPDLADAHFNLGTALRDQGKFQEAVASYRRTLSLRPEMAQAHYHLGTVLKVQGKLEEAIECFRMALLFKPDLAEAHNSVGAALKNQGKLEQAIASYRRALSFKPEYAEAHSNLGVALRDQDKLEEAVASYRTALSFKPELAETHYNLGVALKAQGRRDEAIACFYRALSCKPDFAEARWAIAVSTIAIVGGAGETPANRRTEFEVALTELDNWFCAERVKEGFKAVGSQQPFHLAYQEEDNRDVLSRYGALCFRLMDDWLQRQNLEPGREAPRGNTRLGIVSSHFYNHSVWHALVQGWLQQLERERFQLHLFYLGTIQDDQTALARRNATTFSDGKGGLRQWVETILAQRPDALIYPEIGMDPMTVKLASMRLAPVQICAWGHPHTTGLPSIDYFVSAEGFEPDDAAGHYTERLIRLPHLGCFYPLIPTDPADLDLGALAIDGTLPLLICPGAPFKYAPQHDWVLVDIARKLGRCQLVFFRSHLKEQSDLLQQRLRSVFAQAGLKYDDFAVSLPWQPKRAFHGLMQRADVYLDTIGFSGFNTAMQAVECGLPIVTREGKFMRGRLASGILKRIGLAELVASSEGAYIALAVRLAKDSDYRRHMRERMQESRNALFNDLAPIRALEDFLAKAVNAIAPSPRRSSL